MITLLKIGGNILDDPMAIDRFLSAFSAIPGRKILVHGGGKKATALATQLGVETKMLDGRRITDSATLEIITMVYAGLINKTLVASLNALGCTAMGLTGVDAGIVTGKKRSPLPVDFGFVGDIEEVNSQTINYFLEKGFSMVFAPVISDSHGQLLNVNADTLAAALAISLSSLEEVQLIYCFEQKGVLWKDLGMESVIPALTQDDMVSLVDQKVVHSGMIPKLENAFRASRQGVAHVVIGHADDLASLINGTAGTVIANNLKRP